MMKLVIIESPFKGDAPANIVYARQCLRDSLLRGESPIASHLLYTQPNVLDDNVPSERTRGIKAGHAWIARADLMAVYVDRGLSHGMLLGMKHAAKLGIPIVTRTLTKKEPS